MSDERLTGLPSAAAITQAARTLIWLVHVAEQSERGRAQKAELELHVDLTAGGTETWTITIERTAAYD